MRLEVINKSVERRNADLPAHDRRLDGLVVFLTLFLGLCALIAGLILAAAWYLQQMPGL